MNGVLVVDKPADYTSFDVVAVVRRLAGREKTGHTGTLDPMATGVLPILLGKATRAASLLEDTSKEYRAEFAFGYATDTQDSTGEVLARSDVRVTKDALLAALPHFRGNILQEPPMYSAVRKDGKRLYELARQGITVEREKRPVTIETLECIRFDEASQTGALEVRCSKGTYIRTRCARHIRRDDRAAADVGVRVLVGGRRPPRRCARIGGRGEAGIARAPGGPAVFRAARAARVGGTGGPVPQRRKPRPGAYGAR